MPTPPLPARPAAGARRTTSAPMFDLQELRARTPLLPLIQRHVQLKRDGRLWTGCCPFHDEKSASFKVYPEHYHCFGCGAHGDAITFVRAIQGLSFAEAVANLAAEAGLEAPDGNPSDRRAQRDRAEQLARERAEREAVYNAEQAADRTTRITKAQHFVRGNVDIEGTLGARYLTDVRAIPEPAGGWPDAITWNPHDRSVVFSATNTAGAMQACQRVRLTPKGAKKIKLSAGFLAGAVVRLPGSGAGPLLIAEGPETGTSLWAATGHEVWMTLGGMARLVDSDLPADKGRIIVVCADDDPPAKSITLSEAVERWRTTGRKIAVAQPWAIPRGDKSDFNDVIREAGADAVRERVRGAILDLHGLGAAAPPFMLPTATVADARAALLRFVREAFASAPEGQLPQQILLGAQGGLGKTETIGAYTPHAMLQAKAEKRPWRLIYMVPEHVNVGPQITERFSRMGLNVFRLEGRGDPFNSTPRRKPRCRNLEAVGEAILSGQSVREAVCVGRDGSYCPFFAACNEDGHFADLRRAAEADVVIVAHNFIFEHLPKEVRHDVGWVCIDEDFTAHGDYIRSLTAETFGPDALNSFPVLQESEPDGTATRKLVWMHAALTRVIAAAEDGYLPAALLVAEGLTPYDCAEAAKLNWRRKIDPATTPATDLHARRERREEVAINRQLSTIAAIWHGLERLLCDGEHGSGRIALAMRHDAKGSRREITVHAQREVATWLTDLPVIIAGATTGIEAVQRFFPRAVLRCPPPVATPHAHHRLILGGFGKSTLSRRPKRLEQLRIFLELENIGKTQGIVTHLSAALAFEGMVDTRTVHHGANAGDNSFRDVDVLSVIGGMSAPPAAIAKLAAARSGRAVPYVFAIETTEAVLMRDGTGVAVPVLTYEDPDARKVHRGIYNGSIEQAAARARQVQRTAANPVEVNIFGNVAPGMPIDEIVHWRDIRPDRLCEMLVRGRVYENATHMHMIYPDLFSTSRAATDARARFGDIRGRTMKITERDVEPWSEIAFQPAGQGQHVSRAWCRTHDIDAMQANLEACFGELVYFRALAFTPGCGGEVIRKPVYEAYTESRTTSPSKMPSATSSMIAIPATVQSETWQVPDS